jgi:hypothetical protein
MDCSCSQGLLLNLGNHHYCNLHDLQNAPLVQRCLQVSPFWFTEDTFAVIDRNNCRTISLYRMKQKVKSNLDVHQHNRMIPYF